MAFDWKSIPWSAIADKADSLFASWSRPYIAVICGTAIAGACFNQATAVIAIPAATSIVLGYMGLRTVDKNIAAKADIESKKIDAAGGQPNTP